MTTPLEKRRVSFKNAFVACLTLLVEHSGEYERINEPDSFDTLDDLNTEVAWAVEAALTALGFDISEHDASVYGIAYDWACDTYPQIEEARERLSGGDDA